MSHDFPKKGETLPHHTTHENGGTDEINVAGLSGELADAQTPKAHTQDISTITGHNKAVHDALGIDAATVDGENASDFEHTANKGVASGYCDLDGSVLVPLTRIPATLTGKDADTVDTYHAAALEKVANKNQASGYAGLSASTKLAASQMPTATITTTLSFAVVGTLTTGTDKAPTILAPCTLTIVKVKLVVKTAPTGAAIIVDVNKNGTTIFTTQANRPQIAAGALTGDSGTPDVTALAEGDKITIDIDQIGSTIAGADLTVEVVTTQAVTFT